MLTVVRTLGETRTLMPATSGVAPWLICGLLLVSNAPSLAQTGAGVGSIQGQVDLPRDVAPVARRPDVRGLGMPPARPEATRRRAVVYLEVALREAFGTTGDDGVVIDQRGETFVPHVVAVTAGTEVAFPNSDETYHNVFSLSPERPFDLGRYPSGRSRSVQFERPGIVRVFCDIHSHMSAFVLVFAHRFFAVTDDQGRYRIVGVPPGTYTVVRWHESFEPQSRSVVVPAGGGNVELHFTSQR
jgi:plastocyanin